MLFLAALFTCLLADSSLIDHLHPEVVKFISAEVDGEEDAFEEAPLLRWGILGTSNVAVESIIPVIQLSSHSYVKGIASRSIQRAAAIALAAHIPKHYGSYQRLLNDPDIDVVYIALPNHLHKEWTIKAAKAGKHVLVEKPMACDTKTCQEMTSACTQHRVKLMQAFKHLFHPQTERLQEMIESGMIGEPTLIRISLSYPLADLNLTENHRWHVKQGGGCLLDLGCYCTHLARSVFNAEPLAVTATSIEEAGIDTQLHALLTFSDNRTAMIDCSFVLGERQEIEVIGRKGSLIAKQAIHPGLQGPILIEWNCLDGCGGTEEFDDQDPYKLEVDYFSRCILEDINPVSDGYDAILNTKVLDAIRKAARQGKTIYLN